MRRKQKMCEVFIIFGALRCPLVLIYTTASYAACFTLTNGAANHSYSQSSISHVSHIFEVCHPASEGLKQLQRDKMTEIIS